MNSKEIFTYILATGYNLSSQKILKQPQNNQQTIWEIIVHLCSRLKNKNRDSNFATYVYLIEQHDKHQQSCKWLKQHLMVSHFLKKIKSDYGIFDYLKPQKQKIYALLSKIVQVCKEVDRMNFQNDEYLVKKEMNQKQIQKAKDIQNKITQQLQELKQKKKTELPLYQQKLNNIATLNDEISYKKKEKLDILASERDFMQQKKSKIAILQKQKYEKQQRKLKIIQLKKQVAVNAPQIRKEKYQIQQEFQNLSSEFMMEEEIIKSKQRNLINQMKKREQLRDILQKKSKTIISNLQNLTHSKNYVHQLDQQNSKLSENKKQLLLKESSINNQIQKVSSSNMLQLKKCSQLRHSKQENLLNLNNKQSQQEKLNGILKNLKDSYQKRQSFQRALQDKINHKKKLYSLRQTQIREQVQSFRKLINEKSDQIYEVYLSENELKKINPQAL